MYFSLSKVRLKTLNRWTWSESLLGSRSAFLSYIGTWVHHLFHALQVTPSIFVIYTIENLMWPLVSNIKGRRGYSFIILMKNGTNCCSRWFWGGCIIGGKCLKRFIKFTWHKNKAITLDLYLLVFGFNVSAKVNHVDPCGQVIMLIWT